MNLERYCEIKEELRNIELILQELNTQLYNIRRSNITDMPKSRGSYTNNKIVNLIKKIDIEKEKYIEKYEECFDEYWKMSNIINKFEGLEKRILIERYMHDMTWDDIAKDTGYCRMQIYRIHQKIMKKLENVTWWYIKMWYYYNVV